MAVVDDDLESLYVGDIELDWLGRLIAGNFGFEEHAVVAEDSEPYVSGGGCGGVITTALVERRARVEE